MDDETLPGFDPDRILFHGGALLVVDKPAGVPVHRGTGHDEGVVESVANWVSLHPRVLDIAPGKRVHPIHLLDLEASGVLLLGLTRRVARLAKKAFEEGAVRKEFLAVVSGPVEEQGTLRGPARSKSGGRYRHDKGELEFRRVAGDERLSLVAVVPHGTQNHLIRSLFARSGRPLAGDLRYGKPRPARLFLEKFAVPHLLLHCLRMTVPADILGAERTFEAPVPELVRAVCRRKGWPEDSG